MSSSDFPIDEAQIVGLFMETTFFGIYLVSFAACIRVLLSNKGTKTVNKPMLIVVLAMATFATLDIAFGLRHVLDAFIFYHGSGGPKEEFENISYWVNVMKTVDYLIQTVIGDLMLIYRCFVVYNRRWLVIILPLIVWTGTIVVGCIAVYISFRLQVSTNLDEGHLVPFITSTLALTMVQNLATTSIIAFRIWSIDRQLTQHGSNRGSKLRPVIRIIIESGAIYTLSLLAFLVVYLCSNNAQYGVSDCVVQIIGIVFNLIIIRVHQGRTADQEIETITRTTSILGGHSIYSSSTQPLGPSGKVQTRSTVSGSHYAMQPLQVNVARQVVKDPEDESMFVDSEGSRTVQAKHWPVSSSI